MPEMIKNHFRLGFRRLRGIDSPPSLSPPRRVVVAPLCARQVVAPKVVALARLAKLSPPIFQILDFLSRQIVMKSPTVMLISVDIFMNFGILGMTLMQIFVADGKFVEISVIIGLKLASISGFY